jgi:hypothetical protein
LFGVFLWITFFLDRILCVLQPGSQGDVYVVEDCRNHEKFALKSLFVENSQRGVFEKLISSWKELSILCQYVTKVKEFFYDNNNASLVLFVLLSIVVHYFN